MFDTIYVIKDELQNPDIGLELNGLPDSSTMQDLENLVDEAHITQIIKYHDGEVCS